MKKSRSDPRRWLKLLPMFVLVAALTLCFVCGIASPASAAGETAGEVESMGDSILGVFNQIGEWLTLAIPSFMPMFYSASTGLTFLGWLAIAGLSFSVVFLCLGILTKFFRFG